MAFPRAFETVLTESIQTRGQNAVVFFVMFMMSLALPTDALLAAFKRPLPTSLAVGLNWVVTPLLSVSDRPITASRVSRRLASGGGHALFDGQCLSLDTPRRRQ